VAVIHCQRHQKGDATIAWGNQKADREAKQAALMRGPAPIALTTALFPCPLAEWDPQYTSQEQAWFKTEEGIFYWTDGGNLLMATSPFLSHWFPHLLSSSVKEPIQCEQPLRPSWPSTFMSPSSAASVRRYAKDIAYVPKTIPGRD
jgi:hypothetical protein